MKEESNETNLISALGRCSPTLAEALYGRAENEPERFFEYTTGCAESFSLKRTKLKNSFRHAAQECQNRDPEKMFSQATWKRLSLDVPSRRNPERQTMTKAGERKEENFLIESLVKEMKRKKFFPFPINQRIGSAGAAGRRKEKEITPNWISVKCGLLSRYAQFLRTLSCL